MRTVKKAELERKQGTRPEPKKAAVPAPKPEPKPESVDIAKTVSEMIAPLLKRDEEKVDMLLKLIEAMHQEPSQPAGDGEVTMVVNRDQNGLIESITIQKPSRVLN